MFISYQRSVYKDYKEILLYIYMMVKSENRVKLDVEDDYEDVYLLSLLLVER